MGGIADYSGALVLQWPIRESTRVALMRHPDRVLNISSVSAGRVRRVDVPLDVRRRRPRSVPAGARLVRRQPRSPLGRVRRRRLSRARARGRRSRSTAAPPWSSNPTCRRARASARRPPSKPRRWRRCWRRGRCRCRSADAGDPGVSRSRTSSSARRAASWTRWRSICGEAGRLMALLCQPAEFQGTDRASRRSSVSGASTRASAMR